MSLPPLNLLVAYPYVNQRVRDAMARLGDVARFLIDSGAFTAYRTGRVVTLDGYARFLRDELPVAPWRYFNLDVIGDAAGSDRNYQALLDRGFHPVPIFTRGASFDDLDRLCASSDLVGVGGLVVANNRPHRYIKAVMHHLAGRPAHLLGFVEPAWVRYLQPYSCDASSFTRANRYGYLDVYLGDGKFTHLFRNRVAEHRPPEATLAAIAGMGFDPYALQRWENWSHSHGICRWIAACSWVRFSLDLERTTGIKLFLAAADADLPVLEACYRSVVENRDLDQARRVAFDATNKRKAA